MICTDARIHEHQVLQSSF